MFQKYYQGNLNKGGFMVITDEFRGKYIIHQANNLFKQWEFYNNLTWRIPTMIVTVNAAIIIALRFITFDKTHSVFEPILYIIVGFITWIYAYRLYRATRLAQELLREIQVNFDNNFGVKNVIRRTANIRNWPWWASNKYWGKGSSRIRMSIVFLIWGLLLITWGIICILLNLSILR
jgi:hypothetical protein